MKPRKRFFRQRAHANVFSDHYFDYPLNPQTFDSSAHYPEFPNKKIEFADIGCGYGGLLVSLSPLFPETLMLGIEIRGKVEEYVRQRIVALREEKEYQNISVLRSNSMKFLVNYFEKAQLSKMFILFPDPHFKKKARIITPQLLAEYAYVIRPDGLLYTATDVHELHEWMVRHISAHPMFRQLTEEELEGDVCVDCVMQKTEEGIKVARNNGSKYLAVFERIQVPKGDWNGFSLLKGDDE